MHRDRPEVITEVILQKKQLPELFKRLTSEYDIIGPVQKSRNVAYETAKNADIRSIELRKGLIGNEFEKVGKPDELNLEYTTTVTPPKKFFIPPKEELITFEFINGKVSRVEEVVPKIRPFILFGIHPCDMQGILRLDYAFQKDNPESNYLLRRAQSIIIGVNCVPDEYCFCESVDAQVYNEGFDIFLTNLGTSFLATIFTEKGERLIVLLKTQKANGIEIREKQKALERSRCSEGAGRFKPDYHNMPLLCKNGEDLPFWEEIAASCFSCGTCNLVCPTCYCFDVNDIMEMNMERGSRTRFWDGCQLENFALVAGGENFRNSKTERNKHRFYRKFFYLMEDYSKPFCIGCGRCGRQCVAEINIIETANRLYEALENI